MFHLEIYPFTFILEFFFSIRSHSVVVIFAGSSSYILLDLTFLVRNFYINIVVFILSVVVPQLSGFFSSIILISIPSLATSTTTHINNYTVDSNGFIYGTHTSANHSSDNNDNKLITEYPDLFFINN